jgi:tRNA pseudouridine55 synthase
MLCGFLVIDKPAGITSHSCVGAVRRAYGLKRVGHGGTLDPAVTGVLPMAVGPATRLLPYLEGDKAYCGVVQLGVRTSTDDLEGTVLNQAPVPQLEHQAIEAALADFRGLIQQRPPQVSAVHVDGQRAYARVRQGEQLDLPPRPVRIEALVLDHWDQATGQLQLQVRCSAGTYIRSLARDLGELLGCGGALAQLRRTEALGFGLEQAVSLEQLQEQGPTPLLNPLEALAHLPQHQHLDGQLAGWRCGRAFEADAGREGPLPADQPVAVLAPDGNLAGMARALESGLLQPKLVFDAAG